MPGPSPTVAAAWRPPEDIDPATWAERSIILPPGVTSRPGPLRFRGGLDYWVEPLRWTQDRTVRRLHVVASAQCGKSLALQVVAYDSLRRDPGPVGYYLPTDEDARSYQRDRWRPVLRASPALGALLVEARDADRLDGLRARNGGWLVALGASAPQALKGRPMRVVGLDEVDEIARQHRDLGDPIERAANRTVSYSDRSLVVAVSTPSAEDHGIWPHYSEAQQWEYRVPCLGCGQEWAPEMPHITWEPERLRETVALTCPACGHRHSERDRVGQIRDGRWHCTTPERDGAYRGIRLWRWHSPWTSYAELAEAQVRATGSTARTIAWRNEWLALPHRQAAVARVSSDLLDRARPAAGTVGAHLMARPASERIGSDILRIVAGVDVQGSHCYALYLGVRSRGRYRLLWAGRVDGELGVQSGDLARVLEDGRLEWERVDGRRLGVVRGGIDMGHRPLEVAQLIVRDSSRWTAVRGSSSPRDGIATLGAVGKNGIAPLWIQTDTIKDELARLLADRRIEVPELPKDLARQLASEEKRLIRSRNGVSRERWAPRVEGAANHLWDCLVYAMAAAHISQFTDLPDEAEAPVVPSESPRGTGIDWAPVQWGGG